MWLLWPTRMAALFDWNNMPIMCKLAWSLPTFEPRSWLSHVHTIVPQMLWLCFKALPLTVRLCAVTCSISENNDKKPTRITIIKCTENYFIFIIKRLVFYYTQYASPLRSSNAHCKLISSALDQEASWSVNPMSNIRHRSRHAANILCQPI